MHVQLILGREDYGFEVDIWAAGCVMGEMLNNAVLFQGENRADQMAQIINVLGERRWGYEPIEHDSKFWSINYVR